MPFADLRWHRLRVDGRDAAYGDVGSGPPVLFVHGWGLTSRAYGEAITALARSGHRVVAPALPGFGDSAPLEGPLTFERLAWWTARLCEHAGVDEPAFLIGHSFGGAVATAVAHHHADLARSLTLVNAVGGAVWKPGADEQATRHLAERPIWSWALQVPGEYRRREYRGVLPVVARDFLGNALRNLPALRRAGLLARSADLREELEGLAARGLPVTILWGDQDRIVPEAAFLATCDAVGVTGGGLAGRDHSWLLADPAGFGELLTTSLAVHAAAGRWADATGDAA